jgi:hypothetical protein
MGMDAASVTPFRADVISPGAQDWNTRGGVIVCSGLHTPLSNHQIEANIRGASLPEETLKISDLQIHRFRNPISRKSFSEKTDSYLPSLPQI